MLWELKRRYETIEHPSNDFHDLAIIENSEHRDLQYYHNMFVTLKREEERKDVPLVLFTCEDKLKRRGAKYCEEHQHQHHTNIYTHNHGVSRR